jgi:glycyl-tRNA synthetase beta chain
MKFAARKQVRTVMAEFLFEIGLEEIPARMIAGAQAELQRRVVGMLERERLVTAGVSSKSFATPRRLAVWVAGVAARQEDVSEELLGPATKIAYKDGVATAAAVAFAKKAGLSVGELKTVTNAKGEYLAATSVKAGRGAAEVIAAELPKELAGIYWAKNMYWRAGRPERFVRPVRWMVALLGSVTVPVTFGGYEAGAVTYGHRVLFGDGAISLTATGASSVEYEEVLRKGFVVADVEVRRQKIRKALDHVTRTVPGLRWREDHELVETVTQLTEWPSVVMGGFEKEYLALPEEVLVTVMRDHQKYFAVEDVKQGRGKREESGEQATVEARLAPYFLTVLNTEADEAGMAVIRHGNERVLRARFNDARFFWEFDQRVPLVERVALLEHVTFQKELGSYSAKTERMRKVAAGLAGLVAGRGVAVDASALDTAALLAKTDLTAELVKEFTELQGVVGGLYARAQGFSAAVGDAIYDQYKPVSTEDSVPRTVEGALLAIADKADTIAGMFGLGLEPTGSKDPFALRRAANGIVKILAESGLQLSVSEIVRAATLTEGVKHSMESFFAERVEFYLRDVKGQASDVVKAVMGAGVDDVQYAVARAEAITEVREGGDASNFAAVCSAFKRMKNILSQAESKGERVAISVEASLLRDSAEQNLDSTSKGVAAEVEEMRWRGQYQQAYAKIATLRPVIDEFFERVMVMVPEPDVRANRLALLKRVLGDFSRIADFSEIVVAG